MKKEYNEDGFYIENGVEYCAPYILMDSLKSLFDEGNMSQYANYFVGAETEHCSDEGAFIATLKNGQRVKITITEE